MKVSLPTTRFFGRELELERIESLFAESRALVTVWGSAGAGKTRVALEYANRRSGPCVFCDLSSARSQPALLAEVGFALDLPLTQVVDDTDVVRQIGNYLAKQEGLMLVLDNLEQIVDIGAAVVTSWLAAAPGLKVLVTSRERLGLSAEAAVELPCLGVPLATDQTDAIAASDSVKLFVDRVNMSSAELKLDEEVALIVAELVNRLDGLPLAIELAAARYDLLGLTGLVERLVSPMAVLTRSAPDVAARHATLKDAIAWSWTLLSEGEQQALAQCSVFHGGFDVQAAEAVISGDNDTPLELLEALRGKSLLQRRAPDDEGRVRFGMLASIRDFAREQLDAADYGAATRDRHASYYASAGSRWAMAADGPQAALHLRQLRVERENLVAAVERGPTSDLQLSALLALEPLYASQGPYSAFLVLCGCIPAEPAAGSDVGLFVRALRSRGTAHHVLGDVGPARQDFLQALELAQQIKEVAEEARLLTDLGRLHHRARQLDEALAFYEKALAKVGDTPDTQERGRALGLVGALHHDAQRFDQARVYYRQALDCFLDAGDSRSEGRFLGNIGVLEQELNRFEEARSFYDRALLVLRKVGDRRLEAIALGNLGVLEDRLHNHELAYEHYTQAILLIREVGDPRSEAIALARLGGVHATLGDLDKARVALTEAEQLAFHLRDPITYGVVDLHRGLLEAALSQDAWARGELDRALGYARHAQAKVHAAQTAPTTANAKGVALADISDDARSTLALLQGPVARVEGAEQSEDDALLVTAGARSIRLANRDWVDLRRRPIHRRMLLALFEQHLRRPGRGLAPTDLIERTWPGERLTAESANNRLYVALASLRKLGLRDVIQHNDDGYFLKPAGAIRWAIEPSDNN